MPRPALYAATFTPDNRPTAVFHADAFSLLHAAAWAADVADVLQSPGAMYDSTGVLVARIERQDNALNGFVAVKPPVDDDGPSEPYTEGGGHD